LAKDPKRITLLDVMSIIEGPPATSPTINTPPARALWRAWKQAAKAEREVLDQVTFAELVERVRGPHESMYYI
jgi:DNA-binding IscR family transcriptional regulator